MDITRREALKFMGLGVFALSKPGTILLPDRFVDPHTLWRSKEQKEIYSLWRGIGFGEGWRVPHDLCLEAGRRGIAPNREIRQAARLSFSPSIRTVAFPQNSFIDQFNRANQDPLGSPGWTCPMLSGNTNVKISSNALSGNSTANSAYYSASTFGADCEVYCKLSTKAVNSLFGVYLRIANPNSAGATDGYGVDMAFVNGTNNDTMRIVRFDNDARTVLTSATREVSAADSIGCEIIGSGLTSYYQAGAGSWSSISTFSDSTYSAAGYLGLVLNGANSNGADDFGGGNVTAATPTHFFNRRRASWRDFLLQFS